MNKIIELVIDENDEMSGIDAVSVVSSPAIEENFIALNKHEVELKEIDAEKRILMGAALVPNKQIYRRNDKDEEYHIYFSKDTVRKASELFLMRSNQNNATYEHDKKLSGMSVVESWIIEDEKKDKSAKYGFKLPIGTWMISMKVNNDEVWKDVKEGKVKGFSIEGYFADKYEMKAESEDTDLIEYIVELINIHEEKLESYSDYPETVRNNAKRGIELNEKEGNKCATQVGKIRAQQLSKGEGVSLETIKRMYSYLSRAEVYYDKGETTDCGYISYLLWGGKAAKDWSESKLKQIETNLAEGMPHYLEDGTLWTGPTHKDGYGRLMTGAVHSADSKYLYHRDELAEVGSRGGIKSSPKAPNSDTENKNPKGEGTSKGDASGKSGSEVSQDVEETLQNKAKDFNERYKDKLGYGANIGALKTVYNRGLGAFNTSHSPEVKSAKQWAMARVNAFLYLIKNGRPDNAKYTTDFDLLPNKHPKYNK